MAFLPKSHNQVLATVMNLFISQTTGVTDFNVGSVVRSLMESFAMEMERAYMQVYEAVADAIDTSAYNSFGFQKLAAKAAFGTVTLSALSGHASITINSGSQFAVPNTNKLYTATATTTWPVDGLTSFLVNVVCGTAGAIGNTPQGTITQLVTPISGVTAVSNAAAFITGVDAETSDQRRQRFAAYVNSLARATKSAVEYGAKTAKLLDANGYTTEQVQKALGVDVSAGVATMYIHNGVGTVGGQTTSASLVTATQAIIDGTPTVPGYRAAGVAVTATAATEVDTTIKIVLTQLFPGYTLATVRGAAVQAVKDLLNGLNIGDTLYASALVKAVTNINGVKDAVVATLSPNTGGNGVPATGQLIVSSNIAASQFTSTGTMDVQLT